MVMLFLGGGDFFSTTHKTKRSDPRSEERRMKQSRQLWNMTSLTVQVSAHGLRHCSCERKASPRFIPFSSSSSSVLSGSGFPLPVFDITD